MYWYHVHVANVNLATEDLAPGLAPSKTDFSLLMVNSREFVTLFCDWFRWCGNSLKSPDITRRLPIMV
jgi:hypothetical protein